MKIGLFTDTHYCNVDRLGGERDPRLALEKTKKAIEDFKREQVDLIFCLGDLIDHPEGQTKEQVLLSLKEILEIINSSGIPFYLVPGNHDFLTTTHKDYEENGVSLPPYVANTDSYNFIVLDANYRSSMEHFENAGVEWTDSNLPSKQLNFLKGELKKSDKECIVLVHENIDPEIIKSHRVKNDQEIRQIIKESGKVKLVIQGHYHEGKETIIDDILYITLPALCENGAHRILEI